MRSPVVGELVYIHADSFEHDTLWVVEGHSWRDGDPYLTVRAASGRKVRHTVAESAVSPMLGSQIAIWLSVNLETGKNQINVMTYVRGYLNTVDILDLSDIPDLIAKIISAQAVTNLPLDGAGQQIMQRLENFNHLNLFHWSIN